MKTLFIFTILGIFLSFLTLMANIMRNRIKDFYQIFLMFGFFFLCVLIVLFPQDSFEAAKEGMELWMNRVFPALLPFFIASEIFIGLGVVKIMGAIMEPAMRPLFNVPGIGSFIFIMSISSGYPVGAMLTARLRKENLCTRLEAERLIAFCTTSGPLFMLGAVAIGIFNLPQVGIIIALSHYIACLLIGFLFRFYGQKESHNLLPASQQGSLKRIISAYNQVCRGESRPFGLILGDAVRHGINTILQIGGFIIFFSVLVHILSKLGAIEILAGCFSKLALFFGLNPQTGSALSVGFFEITLGAKKAAELSVPLLHQLVAANVIISWSGLSVHAQVVSIISETDIRYKAFLLSRIMHSILAGFITYCLIQYTPIFASLSIPVSTLPLSEMKLNLTKLFLAACIFLLFSICFFILICIAFLCIRQILLIFKVLSKKTSRG